MPRNLFWAGGGEPKVHLMVQRNHIPGAHLLLCHPAFSPCRTWKFLVPSPSAGLALSEIEKLEKLALIRLCNLSGFGLLKIESDS